MSNPVPKWRKSCTLTAALLLPCLATAQTPGTGPDKTAPAKPGAAPVESTTTYTEATVRAMWIKTVPAITGGSSPFTVRVSPNRSGDAAVGLIEQVLGSAGDMWKSSAWIAAVAASNASNHLLTDHEFLLKVRGFIDGPSAGMLMATTMLALINQDPIRPGVTITGTVNPDGTIGPVSGVSEKLEGASKAGIKELGYPMIDDGDGGQIFKDLEQQGYARGVKMVPIPDIYAAYEFLTGRKLGRPVALDASELNISAALVDKYKMATSTLLTEARSRVTTGEARFGSMMGKMSAPEKKRYADDRDLTFNFIRESEAASKDGSYVLAHSKAIMADASTRMSEKYLQWQQAYAKRDGKALSTIFSDQYAAAEEKLNTMLALVKPSLTAPTLAGRIAGFNDRMQYWSVRAQWLAASAGREDIRKRQLSLEKRAAAAKGKGATDALTKESDQISEDMRDAILHLTILEGRIRAFSEFAGQTFEDNKQPPADQTALNKRLSEAYGPAAAAGLAYFESTVIGMKSQGSDEMAAAKKVAILHNDIAFSASSKAAEHAILRNE
ncbi:MAG TPA: S16 family serine protease, partial [Verrucomicrobiales bacterium]|nr:S16 family serine protease [Verrucomicrobiales bacterium]